MQITRCEMLGICHEIRHEKLDTQSLSLRLAASAAANWLSSSNESFWNRSQSLNSLSLSSRCKQLVQLRLLLVGCFQTSVTVRSGPRLTAVQFALLSGCRPARGARDGEDEFGNPLGVHFIILRFQAELNLFNFEQFYSGESTCSRFSKRRLANASSIASSSVKRDSQFRVPSSD